MLKNEIQGWTTEELGYDSIDEWYLGEWPYIEGKLKRDFEEPNGYGDLIKEYVEIYGAPLVSRTRVVFKTGDGYVIKVPIEQEGIDANIYESQISDGSVKSDIKMTPTSIFSIHELPIPVRDAIIAKAQEVTPLRYEEIELLGLHSKEGFGWLNAVDCEQVGYLPTGEIVAYDA